MLSFNTEQAESGLQAMVSQLVRSVIISPKFLIAPTDTPVPNVKQEASCAEHVANIISPLADLPLLSFSSPIIRSKDIKELPNPAAIDVSYVPLNGIQLSFSETFTSPIFDQKQLQFLQSTTAPKAVRRPLPLDPLLSKSFYMPGSKLFKQPKIKSLRVFDTDTVSYCMEAKDAAAPASIPPPTRIYSYYSTRRQSP